MKSTILLATAATLSGASAAYLPSNFAQRCSDLANNFHLDKTTVLSSKFVKAGSEVDNPHNHPSCQKVKSVKAYADFCRLSLNVSTSERSNVLMEAWLPVNWEKKRFLMNGNGGLGGCIAYSEMNYFMNMGFASVGHNNGHLGDTGVPFFNNPDVVKDYVYRALQTATTVGKKAVKHFYQSPLKKSYFIGCSSGGRQGLKAAQEFPEEYDGIVAGCPANDLAMLLAISGHYYKIFGRPGTPTYATKEQWDAMYNLVISQCDGIDGVLDGVLEDPRMCNPRPEAMMCAPGQTWESHKCLTSVQTDAFRRFYQPFYGSKGQLVYPRMNPGGEAAAFSFSTFGGPPQYTDDWFKYVVYNNASWDMDTDFSLASVDKLIELDTFGVSTFKDLTKLKKTGHKLLTYHGLMDGLISSENSYRYYEHVSRNMSLPSAQLDDFYRFFPIPGQNHCRNGNGAGWIGAVAQLVEPWAKDVPTEGGAIMSMVRWVEDGVAPERIVGRNMTKDGVQTGIKAHCKWPLKNVYLGGDANVSESWGCK